MFEMDRFLACNDIQVRVRIVSTPMNKGVFWHAWRKSSYIPPSTQESTHPTTHAETK